MSTWQARAAKLVSNREHYTDSNLRGMAKIAQTKNNTAMADIYRAELARRRQARRTGADQ